MPASLGCRVRAAQVLFAYAALSFLGHVGLEVHCVCSAGSAEMKSTQALTLPSRGGTVLLSGPCAAPCC